jgi:multicomponent K+:H+ antiporter subunit D
VAGRHFHVLFQLQLMGLNGAFLTGDLFNLFVFFEVLLLASYGLVLHGGGSEEPPRFAAPRGGVAPALGRPGGGSEEPPRFAAPQGGIAPALGRPGGGRLRTRAGLHYVVLNLTGSALFLIAVGMLYGLFGTLNMADLAVKMAAVPAENLGPARAAGLLLFAVFALKAALLPLHLWLPAAYARTSAPVAALFAIMTKVGAYAILRVSTLMFGAQANAMSGLIEPWLLPLALATMMAGMLGVLAARTLREQVAYLVVASVGPVLTAFALGSVDAIAAGLFYLPHSTFAAAGMFLLADRIAQSRGELADRFEPGGAMAGAPLLGGLFFLFAMLLAGLPPLSGFIGKFLLLRAALEHPAWPWILALGLTGGLFLVIGLARSGSLLFFRPESAATADEAEKRAGDASPLMPAIGLLLLALALTVLAGPIHALATATAEQLLQPYHYVHAVLGAGP